MADASERRIPPYIAFKSFEAFLNGLAGAPIPRKIDGSLLGGMSASTRSGLMMTLRYFALIDDEGNARPALEKLAHATDDGRRQALRELLSAYRFMGTLDLAHATPAQLAEAIGAEGATGGTREKCVAFFLKAAEAANVAVSAHILKRKHTPAGRRTRPKRAARPMATAVVGGSKLRHNPLAAEAARSAYDVLMKEIYDPKTMKPNSEEEKAVFTLARYLATKRAAA
jgi:hypothetical protein